MSNFFSRDNCPFGQDQELQLLAGSNLYISYSEFQSFITELQNRLYFNKSNIVYDNLTITLSGYRSRTSVMGAD